MKRFVPALLVSFVLLSASAARAQTPEQKVLELNQQAMEAYLSLDLDRARELLEEALRIVERAGLEGRPLARTYVNLGVIAVGGEQDQQTAFEFFKAALAADPAIEPDPATSTPEVRESFELAKGRYEMETGQQAGAGAALTPEELEAQATEEEVAEGEEIVAGEEAGGYDWGERPRYFFRFGFNLGAATAQPGRAADPQPLESDCIDEATGALRPECLSYVLPGDGDCDGTEFCVRVQDPGILPVFGLELVAGYYVLPRFAVSAAVRFGLGGGSSILNQWLIGVRGQYAAIAPDADGGFELSPFIGASVGQIQIKPSQGDQFEPYLRSGLGSAQVGAVLGVWFNESFGLHATPQIHVFFPRVTVAAELGVGAQVAF